CTSILMAIGLGIWAASNRNATPITRDETAFAPDVNSSSGATNKPQPVMPLLNRVAVAPSDAAALGAKMELPYPVVDTPIDEVLVRVIDAVDLQPVPGATVTFLPALIDMTHEQTRGDQFLHERHGRRQLTERFGQ